MQRGPWDDDPAPPKARLSPLGPAARARRPVFGYVRKIVILGVLTAALAYAAQWVQAGRDSDARQAWARQTPLAQRLALYDAFWSAIRKEYYDQTFGGVDWDGLRQSGRAAAAKAKTTRAVYRDVFYPMLEKLPTSHVAAETPGEVKARENGGRTPGCRDRSDAIFGFQLVEFRRQSKSYLTVGDVTPGSEAAAAGVTPGWPVLAVHVDPTSANSGRFSAQFQPLTPPQVAAFEQGPVNFRRASGPLPAPVQLDYGFSCSQISPTFAAKTLPSGARWIRFDEFDEPTIDKVLAEIGRADAHGVILDLRNNPGGDVDAEIRLLSHLLPVWSPLGSQATAEGQQAWTADLWSPRYDGPLAVLIGPASASASEITAAALKYHHRAQIIGRMSNGSVLVASDFPLPDGGSVQVAIADFTGPDGVRLEGRGVKPDVAVIPTLADIRAGRDPALERAAAAVKGR